MFVWGKAQILLFVKPTSGFSVVLCTCTPASYNGGPLSLSHLHPWWQAVAPPQASCLPNPTPHPRTPHSRLLTASVKAWSPPALHGAPRATLSAHQPLPCSVLSCVHFTAPTFTDLSSKAGTSRARSCPLYSFTHITYYLAEPKVLNRLVNPRGLYLKLPSP